LTVLLALPVDNTGRVSKEECWQRMGIYLKIERICVPQLKLYKQIREEFGGWVKS